MLMRNLDAVDQGYRQLAVAMVEAAKGEDEKAFEEACVAFAAGVETEVIRQAKEMAHVNDTNILASRGVRQLTAAEMKYYQRLTEAMQAPDPRQAFIGLDVVMPETVINQVFQDLTEQHPLLNYISFTNTAAVTKWILSNSGGVAGWGQLNTAIKDELNGSFVLCCQGYFGYKRRFFS